MITNLVKEIMFRLTYYSFKVFPEKYYPFLIQLHGLVYLREKINLSNPQSYNEKMQWLKLNESNRLWGRMADKYAVREFVRETIGNEYLIPLVGGPWKSFDDIDWDALPQKFVLKATHGCGCNLIVYDKSSVDIKKARKMFQKWMKTNYAYYNGEIHYKYIEPQIIAEEYIENKEKDLYDYKVFCFNGKAEYVMFLTDRKTQLKMGFFDLEWNLLPFTYSYPRIEDEVPRPKNLALMIELAEKLSKGFHASRIDFYILNNGDIKFGEITMTSAGGFCKWNPPEYNKILGDKIDLSIKIEK